jgi:D-3-phosphoglycerate dehydrogenase / 2-oxoglutarate reductase
VALDIFVSTTPFGDEDKRVIRDLDHSGFSFDWNKLNRKMTASEVTTTATEARVLIAGTEILDELVRVSPNLKMIARVGIGLDGVPLSLCRERGIAVSWTPDAVTMAVAEFTIGLILNLTRNITFEDKEIRAGNWLRPMGPRIGGSVIGILGLGRIGFNVARLLTIFSPVEVLVCDIAEKSAPIERLKNQGLNVRQVDFTELLARSTILSLHVPLTKKTRYLVGSSELSSMPDGAYLVNTARGGIINEEALHQCLVEGKIHAAAIDVFEDEPYDGPLKDLKNVLLTAHSASCAIDCRVRMEAEAVEDALRFLRNEALRQPVPPSEYIAQSESGMVV